MEKWEEAGFTSKETYDTFIAKQSVDNIAAQKVAVDQAVADAKTANKTAIETAVATAREETKVATIAEINLKKETVPPVVKQEVPKLSIGEQIKEAEGALTDEQWDKADKELEKMTAENRKLVTGTEEGRLAYLNSFVTDDSGAERFSLRPKKQKDKLTITQQVIDGLNKVRGIVKPIGRPNGSGFNPNAKKIKIETTTKPRRLGPADSLYSLSQKK